MLQQSCFTSSLLDYRSTVNICRAGTYFHIYLFAGLFILTWSAVEQLYAIKYLQNYVDGKMQPSVYSFPLRHYKLSFDANSTWLGEKYDTASLSFSSGRTNTMPGCWSPTQDCYYAICDLTKGTVHIVGEHCVSQV